MRMFLSLVAVLILGFGVAAYFLLDIVESELHGFLEEKSVPVHSAEVTGITPTSVTIENIVLGAQKELTIARATVAYRGGTDLRSLRLNLDVENLALRAKQYANGIAVGGVERLWQPTNKALGPQLATIRLEDTDIDITGSQAPEADGELDIGALFYEQPGTMRIEATDVELEPELEGDALTLDYDIAALVATMIEKGAAKQVHAPLSIEGMLTHTLGDENVHHQSTIAALKNALRVGIKGVHRIGANNGEATLTLPHTDFSPSGLSFAALSPGYASGVVTPDMRIAADINARYEKGQAPRLKGVLDIPRMPMVALMAKALGRGATMEGTLKANVPFTFISNKNWRIEQGRIANEGDVALTLLPVKKEAAKAISSIVAAVTKKPELAQVAEPNKVHVRTLDLRLQSTNNQGELRVTGTLAGDSPLFRNDVSMQIDFSTNLEKMLQSMGAQALRTYE
jgi:hypothetical protein